MLYVRVLNMSDPQGEKREQVKILNSIFAYASAYACMHAYCYMLAHTVLSEPDCQRLRM